MEELEEVEELKDFVVPYLRNGRVSVHRQSQPGLPVLPFLPVSPHKRELPRTTRAREATRANPKATGGTRTCQLGTVPSVARTLENQSNTGTPDCRGLDDGN